MKSFAYTCILAAGLLSLAALFLADKKREGLYRIFRLSVSLILIAACFSPVLQFLSGKWSFGSTSFLNTQKYESYLDEESILQEMNEKALRKMEAAAAAAFPGIGIRLSGETESGVITEIVIQADKETKEIKEFLENAYGIPCRIQKEKTK